MANKPQLNNIIQISNNEEAALRLLNKNFDTLNGVIQDYVSRSGEVPTQMQTVLDMGDKRIVNVGRPVDPKDAARLEDIGDAVAASESAAASAQQAANSATRAAGSEANAAASASAAKGYYENTLAMYDPYIKYVYDNRTIYETIYNIRNDIINVSTHLSDLVWNLSTADKTKSLTILGTPTTEVGNINIGLYSSATGYASVAIGPGSSADNYGAAYGAYANATGGHSTAMGCGYNSNTGARATGSYSVAIGNESLASGNYSTALGVLANATAAGAIQLGKGTNSTANTLAVGLNNSNYTLLKANGNIPEERLEEIMIKGSVDPTSSTPGTIGLLYKNIISGKLFICISASPNSAWEEVGTGAGGGTAEVYTNPSLTSSGGICTWTINHTIGSRDILVEVYNTSTYEQAVCTIARTSDNVVTVKFVSSANIGAGAYKAVLAASSAYGTGVFTLNQAADAHISSPANGDVLVYNSGTGLWTNSNDVPFKSAANFFSGNNVFSGVNLFQQIMYSKSATGDSAVAPSTSIYYPGYSFMDKNSIITGFLEQEFLTDGNLITNVGIHRVVGGVDKWGMLAIGLDSIGNAFTIAPTPHYSNDSTNIATTAMVHDLNDTQRTNCVTEIPQDIYLELSSGTLTLKAGSKVYIPNGVGVFDSYTLLADASIPPQLYNNIKMPVVFAHVYGIVSLLSQSSGVIASRPAASSSYALYYATDENKCYFDNGSWVQCSLPFALVSRNDSVGYYSIDQVFNGFGYIGSTVFALPGVKGLAPNYRNVDGTLNNIEYSITSVKTVTLPAGYTYSNVECAFNNIGANLNYYTYDPIANKNSISGGTPTSRGMNCVIDAVNGSITRLAPKTVFHSADYGDVVNLTAPQDIPSTKTFKTTIKSSQGGSYIRPYEMKNTSVVDNAAPSVEYAEEIAMTAGTNNVNEYLGAVGFYQSPTGANGTYLRTGNSQTGTFAEGRLGIYVKNGHASIEADADVRNSIIRMMMPAYSSGTSETTAANTPWTAPSNGWVVFLAQIPNDYARYFVYVVRNEVNNGVGMGTSWECQSGMDTVFPVCAGDVIYNDVPDNSGYKQCVFYPCLGV